MDVPAQPIKSKRTKVQAKTKHRHLLSLDLPHHHHHHGDGIGVPFVFADPNNVHVSNRDSLASPLFGRATK